MSYASSDVNHHAASTQSDENRVLTPETLNCSLEAFEAARSLLNACRRALIQPEPAYSRKIVTVDEDEEGIDNHHHFAK
jgi:hypothetical protein